MPGCPQWGVRGLWAMLSWMRFSLHDEAFQVFLVQFRCCALMQCLRQTLHEGFSCLLPPTFLPVSHLAARREAPIITATDGKKRRTLPSFLYNKTHKRALAQNWILAVQQIDLRKVRIGKTRSIFSQKQTWQTQKIARKAVVRPSHSILKCVKIGIKGIVHNFFYFRSELIFWIVREA